MPDRALFLGRFQPFHLGHLEIVRRLARDHREVVVAIGSANVSHTPTNPFTAGERVEMLTTALRERGLANVIVVPVPDLGRNPLWVSHVRSLVPRFSTVYTNNPLPARLFAEAGYKVAPATFVSREHYEGTRIRALMRGDVVPERAADWRSLVPASVARVVEECDGLARMRDLSRSDGVVEGREDV